MTDKEKLEQINLSAKPICSRAEPIEGRARFEYAQEYAWFAWGYIKAHVEFDHALNVKRAETRAAKEVAE